MRVGTFRVLFLLLLLLTLVPAYSADNSLPFITGRVTAISEHDVTLETAGDNPTRVMIQLLPDTRIVDHATVASGERLMVGARVVICAESVAEILRAVVIFLQEESEHGGTKPSTEPPRRRYYCWQNLENRMRLQEIIQANATAANAADNSRLDSFS